MSPRRIVLVFGCALAAGVGVGLGAVACDGHESPDSATAVPPGSPTPIVTTSDAAAAAASPASTPPGSAPGIDGARELYREGRYEESQSAFAAIAGAASGEERARALLGTAVASVAAGEPEAALPQLQEALLSAPAGSSARVEAAYVLARTLNGLGRPGEAAAGAAAVVNEPSTAPIAPYLAAEVARAYSLAGDTLSAELARTTLLARASLPAELAADLYREAAAEAKEAGQVEDYVAWLTKAVQASPTAADRLELADALAQAGDAGADAYLRAIVEQTPSSPLAVVALERLHTLGGSVDPGLEGQVRYRQHDYPGAQAVLEAALADGTAANPALAAFYLGAVYEETQPAAVAIAAYDAVTGDPAWVHRARYWAAYLSAASGDLVLASARYADLAANGPPGEFSSEAAYQSGALLLRAGDAQAAVAAWDASAANDARTMYWKARALETLGRPADAAMALNAAAASGPFEFHGLEAARRLSGAGTLDVTYRQRPLDQAPDFAPIVAWLVGRSPGNEPALDTSLAAEFLEVGEGVRAEGLLRAAGASSDPWAALAALRAASGLKLTDVAATLAGRLQALTGASTADTPRELLRLAYPVDYVALLDAETRAAGIDPLFLAALVRVESLWDPNAVSVANARGLTQFIPETAFAMANQFNVEDFTVEDLFRPALSLRFGADYIAGLVRRFGRPDAALAAYNGGPSNAERWLAEAGPGARMADLAATIDFSETQRYVASVIEAYAVYRYAWAGDR